MSKTEYDRKAIMYSVHDPPPPPPTQTVQLDYPATQITAQ